MAIRPGVCAAVIAVVAFAATGCTEITTGTPSLTNVQTTAGQRTTAPTPTPTTPEMPYLTVTPVLELTDQTTKPGTKLKFGTQAVVPFYSRYAKGMLGITVTVESAKASDADIDKLPLKDEDKAALRGKMFFFVRESMVNIDGANFTDIRMPFLSATTKSGGFPGTLLGMGSVEVTGCDDPSAAPSDFSVKGARFDQCNLQFGVASDPIASLAYTDKPYESAATRAVTWRN
jgi:hypothetical protein